MTDDQQFSIVPEQVSESLVEFQMVYVLQNQTESQVLEKDFGSNAIKVVPQYQAVYIFQSSPFPPKVLLSNIVNVYLSRRGQAGNAWADRVVSQQSSFVVVHHRLYGRV